MKRAMTFELVTIVLTFIAVSYCEFRRTSNCTDGCFEEYFHEKFESYDCCHNTKPLTDPCKTRRCPAGMSCVVKKSFSDPKNCSETFPLIAQCRRPCPLHKCGADCVITVGSNHCPSCYCNTTYENSCNKKDACQPEERCILEEVICKKAPCYPRKQCLSVCPMTEKCPKGCVKYEDDFGCLRCQCCNNCVDKPCPAKQKCVLNVVECFVCPCPPLAECVDM